MTSTFQQQKESLQRAYQAFNARDIDSALKEMKTDVKWPNGWEGGYVQGHAEVRAYWTRQWKEVNPKVEPQAFKQLSANEVQVTVHQLVKDPEGTVLFDGLVKHSYTFNQEKVATMEIQVP